MRSPPRCVHSVRSATVDPPCRARCRRCHAGRCMPCAWVDGGFAFARPPSAGAACSPNTPRWGGDAMQDVGHGLKAEVIRPLATSSFSSCGAD